MAATRAKSPGLVVHTVAQRSAAALLGGVVLILAAGCGQQGRSADQIPGRYSLRAVDQPEAEETRDLQIKRKLQEIDRGETPTRSRAQVEAEVDKEMRLILSTIVLEEDGTARRESEVFSNASGTWRADGNLIYVTMDEGTQSRYVWEGSILRSAAQCELTTSEYIPLIPGQFEIEFIYRKLDRW